MWFDESVVESIAGALPVWAAVLLVLVSYLGSIYVIVPTAVLVYLRRTDWRTATWPGVVLGGYGLFVAVKPLTGIQRPGERGVESPLAGESLPVVIDHLHEFAVGFDTGSFPSGHAIAVTVLWGLIVADLDIGTRRQRLAVGVVWIAAVCFSRVALATHYIGDIVGGVVLGLAFLGVALVLRQALNERPWRTVGPVEGTAVLGMAFALVAIPVGRPVDGALLLAGFGAILLAHRALERRNIDVRQRLSG